MDAIADRSPAALAPKDVRSIMIGLMVAMMLAALDTTIIAPAMPTIGRELGDIEHLPWIVTSYLLVSTALTPLYGKFADIRGRRPVLLFAVGTFLLGSAACALAPNMIALALARGLQGVGGAGIFAMSQTIIGDIVPPKERPRYQVYTSAVWMVANVAGPVLGGVLAEYTHWSMIFWINLPIGLVALWLINDRLKRMPRNERPHRLDMPGALLMIAASTLLLLALSWGGARYAWASPQILGLFAAAAAASAALVWRQATAEEPLIPLTVLANPVIGAGASTMFFAMAAYVALSIYLPVYLQTLGGMSVSASGLALIPLLVFTSFGAGAAARVLHVSERYKRAPMAGLVLATLSMAAMALWPRMPFWGVMAATTVMSLGVGTLFPVINVCVQAATPRHELGTTMALMFFLRSLGAAVMIAVFGAVVLGGSGVGVEAIAHGGGLPPGMDAAALTTRFATAFWLGTAAFAIATLCFAMLEERPLFGERGARGE
ncbi:MAG TPA: MDR family MFS transporter [Beijerinckiaceae bacterium]|jgi:EmrB/QacA subfamily drug resistance transporter